MKIVLAGATGLIGTALRERLLGDGHTAVRLVRSEPQVTDVRWDPVAEPLPAGVLDGADAIVNLAGAGIGDKRWTDAYRRVLVDSRVVTTSKLAAGAAEAGVPVLLSGSAIGVYGNRGDEVLTESSSAGGDFLATLCTEWEAAARRATSSRVVLLRTAMVLSANGGALRKQLPLFKVGLGGRMGSGNQWVSWITLDDHVAATVRLLTGDIEGPVNLAAPNPVTQAEFASALGAALHRPTKLPIPAFGPRLILGRDLADSLLFASQRVIPKRLSEDGFAWAHPSIGPALTAMLQTAGAR